MAKAASSSSSPLLVDAREITYEDFVSRYLLPNRPCVLTNVINGWTLLGSKAEVVQRMMDLFGRAQVPVLYPNKRIAKGAATAYGEEVCSQVVLEEYFRQWEEEGYSGYLKDWHFFRDFPEEFARMYETPLFFKDDWLNEWCDYVYARSDITGERVEDFRFLYCGPKGSSTALHHDVFCSYSWSANVFGRKRWVLYRNNPEASLAETRAAFPEEKLEIVQEAATVIFVPSGWYHEVLNLEPTLSINHNWFNAFCLPNVSSFLFDQLTQTRASLEDIKKYADQTFDHEYEETCQRIMKLNIGMNFVDFTALLAFKCNSFEELEGSGNSMNTQTNHDKRAIRSVIEAITKDENLTTLLHRQSDSLTTALSLCHISSTREKSQASKQP